MGTWQWKSLPKINLEHLKHTYTLFGFIRSWPIHQTHPSSKCCTYLFSLSTQKFYYTLFCIDANHLNVIIDSGERWMVNCNRQRQWIHCFVFISFGFGNMQYVLHNGRMNQFHSASLINYSKGIKMKKKPNRIKMLPAHIVQSLIKAIQREWFSMLHNVCANKIVANRTESLRIKSPRPIKIGVPDIAIAPISMLMIMRIPSLCLLSETLWWTKHLSGRDDVISPPGQIKRLTQSGVKKNHK